MDGSVDIEGSVSYASQDPWIFSGTMKDNILFGQDYDEAWYDRVVECCCLVKVYKTFITFIYNEIVDFRTLMRCHLVMIL